MEIVIFILVDDTGNIFKDEHGNYVYYLDKATAIDNSVYGESIKQTVLKI